MTACEKDERPGLHSRGVQPEVISVVACVPRETYTGTVQEPTDEPSGGDAS